MKKLYTLALAAAVAVSASAAQRELRTDRVAKHEAKTELQSQNGLRAQTKRNATVASKKVAAVKKANEEAASIEGLWTFELGDYYFQSSVGGPISVDFEATLEGTQVFFEDPTGYELPMVAEYDEAASTFTFITYNFGSMGTSYAAVKQEPFVYNWDTKGLDVQDNIVGTYDPSTGILSFEEDNGLSWKPYTGRGNMLLPADGYFWIYDLLEASNSNVEVEPEEPEDLDEVMEGQWLKVGYADFVDAWILPSYSMGGVPINPMDYPLAVELQQNVDNKNLYRLWKPYTNGNHLLAQLNLNESTYEGQIIFDIEDAEHVVVKPGLPAGFKNSNGEFFTFGMLGWQINSFGDEYDADLYWDLIIDFMISKGQAFDTFDADNRMVTINPRFDFSSSCENVYNWTGNTYQSLIFLPDLTLTVKALDADTKEVVKNLVMEVGGLRAKTGDDGVATFSLPASVNYFDEVTLSVIEVAKDEAAAISEGDSVENHTIKLNGANNEVEIETSKTSGIENVTLGNAEAATEYFNLQGIRIENPVKGQVVIKRQGDKAEKVVVK